MVATGGAKCKHLLGLVVLWMVGTGCQEHELQTRPSSLSQPVASCAGARPDESLQLPQWDLFVLDADWDHLHADVKADVEVRAQLCIRGKLEPIRLELQGTSGRTRDKKSFKIKFRRDHALSEVGFDTADQDVIDKVYLKAVWVDPSMVREAVAFDLWREMGHDAPRTGFANLRINGDYWGLYTVIEPVDDEYLDRNGYPSDGNLYKGTRKHGSRADFAPGRNLSKAFENKSDDDESRAGPDLEALVSTLQKTPLEEEAYESDIDPIFPIDEYIDRIVWVSFTRNGDAVAQNFYLYNAPRGGHDFWRLIPWDSDLCMGANWRSRDEVVPPDVNLLIDGGNYYSRRLTMVPGIRERYVDRFRQVLDEVLTEPVTLRYLSQHARRIRRDLAVDQQRWQWNVGPEEAFDAIQDFLEQRPKILRTALHEFARSASGATEPGAAAEESHEEFQ
jgi:spore coat protein H